MAITTVFDPPQPSDSPAVFDTKAFTLLGDLNTWSTEANAVQSDVNAKQSTASAAADTASTQAGIATTKASEATSGANTATTQAGIATTKASEASASASSAASSAASAASSAASIDPATLVKLTGDQTIEGIKTFSSAPVVPGINGGQLAGMRNKIINGHPIVARRGTSFASVVTGSYTLDRWSYSGVAGTSVATVSQQTDVPSDNEFQSSLRVAVTTADTSIAAGEVILLSQPIEGYNVRDLIGKTFTLSFRVRSSKTGVHCVALRNSGTDRSYVAEYTINSANTWETKSITVSSGLITAGTWNWTNGTGVYLTFALAAGSTFQTTAGAWQTGNFLATANQVNCLDTVGNIFAITGVQLEVGSVATPFEHRPYGLEEFLCSRYGFPIHAFPFYAISTTSVRCVPYLKAPLRAVPSSITVSTTASGISNPLGANGTPSTVSGINYINGNLNFDLASSVTMTGLTAGASGVVTATGFVNSEL